MVEIIHCLEFLGIGLLIGCSLWLLRERRKLLRLFCFHDLELQKLWKDFLMMENLLDEVFEETSWRGGKTSDAVEILRRRYLEGRPGRQAAAEAEKEKE